VLQSDPPLAATPTPTLIDVAKPTDPEPKLDPEPEHDDVPDPQPDAEPAFPAP